MKKFILYIALLPFFLNSQNPVRDTTLKVEPSGQEKSETKQEWIKKNEALDTTIKELNKVLKQLKAELDKKEETDRLSVFKLDRLKVKVKNDSIDIDKVEICLNNGLMIRTRILLKNGDVYETTKRDAMQLFQLNKYIEKISLVNTEKKDTIHELAAIISYIDELDKSNYLSNDEMVVLSKDKMEKELTFKTDLNSLIDFRVYTDMLALLNKEGNGLVQTEVSSKITINPRLLDKHLGLLNYAEPMFKLSKFDNQFKQQSAKEVTDTSYNVDRLKLNQYAYIELSFRLNLLKLYFYQHSFDLGNVGIDFKYSDVHFDSLNITKALNTFGAFIESRGTLLKYKNFGLDFGGQFYLQKIQDSKVKNYNIFDPYVIYDFSIFYHPKANPLSMVFLRFKNVQTLNKHQEFYSLLQFGYKTRLSLKGL